jgi:thiol-disulfide isomerase/thioredoxin
VSAPRGGGLPVSPTGVLVGACVLVASAAAGFLAYRLSTPSHRTLYPDTARTLSPRGTGDASAGAAQPEPESSPAVAARKTPEVLPDITLPDLDGTPRRLTQWKGKPLLINFWATWCEPCRREIPLLKTLRRERASEGLEVVGIAVDFRDVTGKYARSQGIDYPVLVGEQGGLEAVSAFGMDTVLPFSVFADSKGRILTLKIGELHRDEAILILDRLAEVDAGKISPAAARSQLSAALEKLNARRVADTGS